MAIARAVTPLRMIFWGALLCVFDASVSSTTSMNGRHETGFRFDFLNDFVGWLLITVGVSRLSAFAVDASFRTSMKFVFVCSVLNCIEAFMGHFVFESPVALDALSTLLGLASLFAAASFCTSMKILSSAYALRRSAESWALTRWLVIIFWIVLVGLAHLAHLGALVTGRPFNLGLGVSALPVLIFVVVPLVHLLLSISRMRREAVRGSGANAV